MAHNWIYLPQNGARVFFVPPTKFQKNRFWGRPRIPPNSKVWRKAISLFRYLKRYFKVNIGLPQNTPTHNIHMVGPPRDVYLMGGGAVLERSRATQLTVFPKKSRESAFAYKGRILPRRGTCTGNRNRCCLRESVQTRFLFRARIRVEQFDVRLVVRTLNTHFPSISLKFCIFSAAIT